MLAQRLFLAIDIPNAIREHIAQFQNEFKSLGLEASWVRPANFHLTLKFLGNTHPRNLPEIENQMHRATETVAPLSLSVGRLGVFPNPNRPRVLWVGIENPGGALAALQQDIEQRMEAAGFAPNDKPAVPHLTLARIKSAKGTRQLKEKLRTAPDISSEPFRADCVQLIRSELGRKGASYTILKEFPLRGAAM